MTINAYPKVALAITTGEGEEQVTIRVWGNCDQVELSAGMWPNVAELRCPKHEFAKLAGDYEQTGTLELYWSDPDTPDVELVGWSIDHVGDSLTGKEVGQPSAEVLEKTLYLTDRRWEFLDGRGGHVFCGLVNQSLPNGTGVSNPAGMKLGPYTLPAGGAQIGWLMMRLMGATGAPGLMRYASGLDSANFESALTIETLDVLLALPMPRDLKWDSISAPKALQSLLDLAECVWVVSAAGEYELWAIGDGPAPTLNNELPSEAYTGRSVRPGIVIITSAPRRAIDQHTVFGMSGEVDPCWEYVGVDTDGTIKPLASLSYVIAYGDTAEAMYQNNFDGVTGPALQLAVQSLFRMIRLKSAARHKYLPMLSRTTDTVIDADGSKRPLPIRVAAYMAQQHEDGLWYNSASMVDLAGYSIDPVNGVISFPSVVGKVGTAGASDWQSDFAELGEDELKVTFAHEASDYGDYGDYYTEAWTLDAGGGLISKDILEAMAADDANVISLPELVEMRLDGVPQNLSELSDYAEPIAARVLGNAQDVRVRRYQGLQSVSPNGNIPTVRWDVRAGVTEVEWLTYFIAGSRYMERKALHDMSHRSADASRSVATVPAMSQANTRDFAQPPYSTPGGGITVGGSGNSGSTGFVAKIVSGSGPSYTVLEQIYSSGWIDKPGATNIGATNLAELLLGSGNLAAGTRVVVGELSGAYVFDHPVYAKYLG